MTPAELAALTAELHNDPEGLGYAAHLPGDPYPVTVLLNAPNYSAVKTRYVTARTILAECADGAAILDALQAAGQSVSAVKWMMTFLQQDSGMDAGHPKTQKNIDDLATAGLLSSGYAAELKALAVQPASRADVLGLAAPTARDVMTAWSNA
jgi:hypothetical protein